VPSEVRDSTVNSRSVLSMRPAGISAFWAGWRLDVLHRKAESGERRAVIDPDAHGIAPLAVDAHIGHAVEVLEAVDDEAVDIVGEGQCIHASRSAQ
jgi:hypothetical protein